MFSKILQCLLCYMHAMTFRANVGYATVGLMTEVNSVFLHARKLMQLQKWPFDHSLYRSVIVLNFLTFIIFRIVGLFIVLLALLIETRVTWPLFTHMWVVMILMFIINFILLWRLVKNDCLRSWRKKSKVEMNGNYNTLNKTLKKME